MGVSKVFGCTKIRFFLNKSIQQSVLYVVSDLITLAQIITTKQLFYIRDRSLNDSSPAIYPWLSCYSEWPVRINVGRSVHG